MFGIAGAAMLAILAPLPRWSIAILLGTAGSCTSVGTFLLIGLVKEPFFPRLIVILGVIWVPLAVAYHYIPISPPESRSPELTKTEPQPQPPNLHKAPRIHLNQNPSTPSSPASPVIVVPPVGNLKQRVLGLSSEIIDKLCGWGWESIECAGKITGQAPMQREKRKEWLHELSNVFRWTMLKQVDEARKDLADANFKDAKLDQLVEDVDVDDRNNMDVDPFLIEQIALRLRTLAQQIGR